MAGRRPTRNVVFARPHPELRERRVFIKVGVAWWNAEKQAMFIQVDAMPINFDGKLECYPVKEKDHGEEDDR